MELLCWRARGNKGVRKETFRSVVETFQLRRKFRICDTGTQLEKHDSALLTKEKISIEIMLINKQLATFRGVPHMDIVDNVIVSSSASWST